MIIAETPETAPEDAINNHRQLASIMKTLVGTDGWQALVKVMKYDMESQYALMRSTKSGDEALIATTKYVILKDLIELPEKHIEHSYQRANDLEKQLKSVVIPKHHRSEQFKKPK